MTAALFSNKTEELCNVLAMLIAWLHIWACLLGKAWQGMQFCKGYLSCS